jgi:SAM-dependent methyltransferase
VERAALQDRVTILEGDFLNLPDSVGTAHFAFSIEAFVHGPDPAAYFRSAAEHVAPGGMLVVCDDFATFRAERTTSESELRCLDEIRRGWLANTLISPEAANEFAGRAGFRLVQNADLTPYLELGRPRDHLIRAAVAVGRRLPLQGYRWRSLLGGNALQHGLLSGLVQFRFLAWLRV